MKDRSEVDRAEEWTRLYTSVGRAIANWSILEHALAEAFSIALGLPQSQTDRMFFSARSFNSKHDMLRSAIQGKPEASDVLESLRLEVFGAAGSKSQRFAAVRNKIAHGRHTLVYHGSNFVGAALAPNVLRSEVELVLRETLLVGAIDESAVTFKVLAGLLRQACISTDQGQLESLLRQVKDLAPVPYSDRTISSTG